MSRRLLLRSTVIGLAAAAAPAWSLASSGSTSGSASESPVPRAVSRHFVAAPTGFHQVDVAPAGDSAGDEIVDVFTLSHGGRRVGRLLQVCTLVAPKKGLAHCRGTATVHGDRLEVAGIVDGSRVTTLAVSGGTGRFRSAGGALRAVPHGRQVQVLISLDGER